MKFTFVRFMAVALAALAMLTACTPAVTPEEGTTTPDMTVAPDTQGDETSDAETQGTEEGCRETYEDLSQTVPSMAGDDSKTITVRSEGESSVQDVVLEFNGESGLFTVSSLLISGHDACSCDTCGFLPDGEGYLLNDHGHGVVGFRIDMIKALNADAIQSIEVVYTTSVDASSSQLRILTADETDLSVIKNDCPSMAGAVGQDKVLNLTLRNPSDIADTSGNVSAFQLYYRNKDKAVCTLKKVIIRVSPEKLLKVDELEGNFYGSGEVIAAIAGTIADRLTAAGMGADITVEAEQFRRNRSNKDGYIRYKATAAFADGSSLSYENTLDIPHLNGSWLDNSSGGFGSSHDNLGQWQDSFDPSGMVLLTANPISAKEGMLSAEYAVIVESGNPYDPSLVWHKPHILEMSNNSIDTLFVNAWLDYAADLNEGERYRLLVRGVTAYSNYVLHLDIPFTYSPLDVTVTERITCALSALNEAGFICPSDTPDKVAYITEQIKTTVNDSAVDIKLDVIGEGVNSITVRATVLYNGDVTAKRMPAYTLNGESWSAVYAFEGDAVTSDALRFTHSVYEGSIQLLTPYDGDANVVLASPEIHALFNASSDRIEGGKYPFKRGENCLPVPVELTWTDSAVAEKDYTVTVSKNLDLSDPIVLTTADCHVSLYHLEVGRSYFWQVSDGETTSQIFTFTTALTPRFFALNGISNVRDVGGYYTVNGKRVKQNMVFRSAHLDDASVDAKNFIVNTLGIKTELDLRGLGSPAFSSNKVNRVVISLAWYNNVLREENYEPVRQTISAFAYRENYPILYHCAVGRDRTGTTSFLLLGLLGVDKETILKEHYSSYFSAIGSCERDEFREHVMYVQEFFANLSRYAPAGATLQEQVEAYLLRVGVTAKEIASIRSILLEK